LGKWFQRFGRTVVPSSSGSSSPSRIAMQEESVVWVADDQSGRWQNQLEMWWERLWCTGISPKEGHW